MAIDFSTFGGTFRNLFGEAVTYTPRGGEARAITAVIDRQPSEPIKESDSMRPVIHVHVSNSATTGVSSSEIDTGGDTLAFAKRIGEAATTFQIARIVHHDNGMMILEVR